MTSAVAGVMALSLLFSPLPLRSQEKGSATPVKVACVGNSITYGYGLSDRERTSYPSVLQRLLGDNYKVANFGLSGATLLDHGHRPYRLTEEYPASLEYKPDIVVIHLGINDTDPRNWPEYGDEFVGDYLELIESYRKVNPEVRIIISRLTPLTARHFRFRSGTRDWRLKIQDAIENVARAANVELIDFDAPLRDRENLFKDAVHPNERGAEILAETVYGGITGDYGGLSLPEIYTSGMVLQRDRPLNISGKADNGSTVTLTLDGQTYRTKADNLGKWSVTTAPITVGPSYTMTVTDGEKTIRLDDILAGEVWLASGQSNMEFMLKNAKDGKEAMATATDDELRFFDMKPIVSTWDVEWDSLQRASVDELKYYSPSKWTRSTPETAADMSAVAYYFGKMLRDSLNVPVGIINNAIGGSTTESWVDMATLERDIPEATANWLTNDYTQKWAQGRAKRNMGSDSYEHRHPYEPGYLFATGIRPFGSFPLKGVIWYQGESNAHNTEVHEQLFKSLIDSWRRHFDNPELPFYYVQLSSIARPSWPGFRDSQRRLEKSAPHLGMAVSSDHGDSLDVHPTNKRPVGERLGRIALHDTYGRDIVSRGPVPTSASSVDGAVYITFDNADGLRGADGDRIRTFEVAEIDGVYRPAIAEIVSGNRLKVYSMDINRPRFVRYGWQPFTRANLVNSEGLPASTFKMEVGNLAMFEPEEGIEYGVSAPFFGTVGDRVVVVGGCNFPTLDPCAPGAEKRFYSGIYTGVPAEGGFEWTRIGALPEGRAYGVAISDGDALYLIGGDGADGKPLATVDRLTLADVGKTPVLETLPSLPVTLDNMAGCLSGRNLYVAGGNCDGTPSNLLFTLDLDNIPAGWKKAGEFPGNPRVQPVMASADNGRIYLWGGFAGKSDRRQATLETGGLMYDPAKGKWSKVKGPRDSSGEEVSLGGGAIGRLSDGRFVAAGGVNKDIFLDALRNQAPDYLSHPIEWYRFNPALYIYDPAKDSWTQGASDPAFARAGAALVVMPDDTVVIYGGELKPRIRSAQTAAVSAISK